jgi:hypothetical protein
MKQYKNFITSGCSFTASAPIDGPVHERLTWKNQSSVWPHYTFLALGPEDKNFLNFAMPGGGNVATLTNLVYYLEINKDINPLETLIGLNLTGISRQDVICRADHPKANQDPSVSNIKEKLNIGWAHGRQQYAIRTQGVQEIELYNMLAIVQGITYIESKNIDYFFMLMNSYIYTLAPSWFRNFLDAREKHWVKFDNQLGMWEFVKQKKLTTSDEHPSQLGHQLISNYILQHLNNE